MRALLLGQGVDINGGPDAPTSLADRRTPHSSCAANAFWCCELLVQRPDGPSMSRRARLPAMLPVDVVALSQALRFLRTVGAGVAKAARLRMNVKASPLARATAELQPVGVWRSRTAGEGRFCAGIGGSYRCPGTRAIPMLAPALSLWPRPHEANWCFSRREPQTPR